MFTDHALGPWVPLVSDKPHVIHCHDFLAQQSAAALIPGNPVGYSGKLYQKYIRSGFLKGKNFISVSQKTKADLEENLPFKPAVSEVVYNGLNRTYRVVGNTVARAKLKQVTGLNIDNGYVLHIGGNQWYKNRAGLVEIYDAWRRNYKKDTALVLIGTAPDDALLTALQKSGYKNDIHLLTEADDELVNIAYSGADVFMFPSKAEGFGWPIAEAMASGAPVITTGLAPMTEVGGDAAFFIPAKPYDESKSPSWAEEAAIVLEKVLTLSTNERNAIIKAGLENIKRFDTDKCLDKINEIYLGIMNETVVEHGNK